MKKLHYYLTKHPFWSSLIILVGLASAIYGFWPKNTQDILEFNDNQNTIEIGDNNDIKNTLFAQNSPGATLVVNENKTIPYPRNWKIKNAAWSKDWIEMYNVLFILPNGKKALLPKMEAEKEYIIAYANEDCSDIYISEVYQLPDDFNENNVCYIKRLFCGEDERSKALDTFSQKVDSLDNNKESFTALIKNSSDNSMIPLTSSQEEQLLSLRTQELRLLLELQKIIKYSPTEQSLFWPDEKCVKYKNQN